MAVLRLISPSKSGQAFEFAFDLMQASGQLAIAGRVVRDFSEPVAYVLDSAVDLIGLLAASTFEKDVSARRIDRLYSRRERGYTHTCAVYLVVHVLIVQQVVAVELVEGEREDLLEDVPWSGYPEGSSVPLREAGRPISKSG